MARELLRSVDGRQLPNLGEVAVYWPNVDCTSIYDTTGFEFTDKPDNGTYPELIEHDAEATAFALLSVLQNFPSFMAGVGSANEWLENRKAALSKATGSAA